MRSRRSIPVSLSSSYLTLEPIGISTTAVNWLGKPSPGVTSCHACIGLSPSSAAFACASGSLASYSARVADPTQQLRRQHEWLRRNRFQAEQWQYLAGRDFTRPIQPTTRPGQQAQQRLGSDTPLSQRGQARVAMPFRQSLAIGTDNEGNMGKARWRQVQGAIEKQLPRR